MTSSHAITASATNTASAREATCSATLFAARPPGSSRRGSALVLALALVVAACGGGSGGISITDAWARNSPAAASAGAAYMVIENTGSAADALIGASSAVAKANRRSTRPSRMPAASRRHGARSQ